MNYEYRNKMINYHIEGDGPDIILLHGWGTNMYTFSFLAKELIPYFKVHMIDLIGFGLSDSPQSALCLDDYVDFLSDYINRFNIERPILLGHSFGGRIAIKYTSTNNNVNKLILVDSAGIKKRMNLVKYYKVLRFKFKRKYYKLTKNVMAFNNLIAKSGSYDYQVANNEMKGTLSKIVKEDLRKCLKKINTETLLIWGKDDKETPYKDAILMKKLIKNSGLVTLDNIGHFPHLETRKTFHTIIKNYLGVEK